MSSRRTRFRYACIGLLALLLGCLPLTSLAAVTLTGISCPKASVSGSASESCTVTMSGKVASSRQVTLSSSSSAVAVPSSMYVWTDDKSDTFTAKVAAVTTAQSVTLTATSGGVSQHFVLALTPSGTSGAPGMTLSASSLSFGSVNLNTAAAQSITITSSGTAALTISSLTLTGAGFSDAALSLPLTLSPGQTASLQVTFDPTVAGAASGIISLSTNAASAATTVALSGTGIAPTTPAALSALSCSSSSLTGAATDTCTVSLTAAAPSGGMAVTLASSSSAVTVPASVTVAAGSTTATFAATAAAVSTAQTATVSASAGTVTKTVSLSLTPATATLTLGSTSVAFGSVALNTTATQSVTMTSSGTAAVTVSAAAVTGTGFSVSGTTFPVTLNPGQAATLNLQFDPKTAGASTGSLALTSNCSMGAMTVALSGTGEASTAYTVELSWDAPANSADPVVGYNVYRATGSGGFEKLNTSVNATVSYNDTTAQAGSSYQYEVTSVDASGVESTPSNVYTATIP